jgi:hypothetical protein
VRPLAWVILLAALMAGGIGTASVSAAIPTAVPTPTGARPATIYEVDSLETSATVSLTHTFYNSDNTVRYSFADTLGPGTVREYHVADMAQIPTPWAGTLTITVEGWQTDPPVRAGIIGYDYQDWSTNLPIIKR